MANNPISGLELLSSQSYSAGDSFDLGGSATFVIDESSLGITVIYFNNGLQRLVLRNNSTTEIIILNITNALSGSGGTIEMDTGFITLSSPYVVPVDSLGDRPSHIGYFVADGETYTECTSFANMHADERGLHFIYDNVTGAITVGNGTNGKIPSGDIQIPNFYIEMNSRTILLDNGRLIGDGALAINKSGFSASQVIDVEPTAYWGITNPTGSYLNSNIEKSSNGNFCMVQTGSNNRGLKFGETSSTDHILFSIEAIPTAERVTNYLRPLRGVIEARYLTQPASAFNFPFTALNNDGGEAVVVDLGGNKNTFQLEGGVGGRTYVKYSTGYRRTDNSFYVGLISRNQGVSNGVITGFERIGSESWPSQSRHFIKGESGDFFVGSPDQDIIFPADADFYEFFNVGGDTELSVNRVINNGTSARGSRDYNLYAPRGGIYSNIRMPNDNDHGGQRQKNTEYHYVTMIGYPPALDEGMNHSEIITNSAGDQVSVWMLPYTASSGNILFSGGKSYYEPNAVVEQYSGTISGVGITSNVIIHGNSLWNFTIDYKVWEKGTAEPDSYTLLNTANVQADEAGFTTSTRQIKKIRVIKNTDALDSGYISGIEFQCPADPSFVWYPDAESMTVDFSGDLLSGDAIRIENAAGETVFYEIVNSSTKQVLIDGDLDGDTLKFAADRKGFAPAVGSFVVSSGDTLPVSLSLKPYPRANGDNMYSGSVDPAISVSFDLATPEMRITIDNKQVEPQDLFNAVENALITEDGMAWHSQQGTIVRWDDLLQSGVQLFMESGIRLFGIGLNAGVRGIIDAVDDEIVAAGSSQVTFGSAYKEYTQEDRDRDDLISSRVVDVLGDTNELQQNQGNWLTANTTGLSTFDPSSDVLEDGETYDETLRILRAESAGLLSVSGDSVSMRDKANTKDRITATTDSSGNRSNIVTDGS